MTVNFIDLRLSDSSVGRVVYVKPESVAAIYETLSGSEVCLHSGHSIKVSDRADMIKNRVEYELQQFAITEAARGLIRDIVVKGSVDGH